MYLVGIQNQQLHFKDTSSTALRRGKSGEKKRNGVDKQIINYVYKGFVYSLVSEGNVATSHQ